MGVCVCVCISGGLSVWNEVQIVCMWSSWCHCIPEPRHLLPHLHPDWFYVSATGLPRPLNTEVPVKWCGLILQSSVVTLTTRLVLELLKICLHMMKLSSHFFFTSYFYFALVTFWYFVICCCVYNCICSVADDATFVLLWFAGLPVVPISEVVSVIFPFSKLFFQTNGTLDKLPKTVIRERVAVIFNCLYKFDYTLE